MGVGAGKQNGKIQHQPSFQIKLGEEIQQQNNYGEREQKHQVNVKVQMNEIESKRLKGSRKCSDIRKRLVKQTNLKINQEKYQELK